jgi:hypothetical protein
MVDPKDKFEAGEYTYLRSTNWTWMIRTSEVLDVEEARLLHTATFIAFAGRIFNIID